MTKNEKNKLIAGLGALLVLTAWFLEWGSVNHWQTAEQSLRQNVNSLGLAGVVEEMRYDMQLLQARSDRTIGSDLRDLAPVWDNAGIRILWHRHTLAILKGLMLQQKLLEANRKDIGLAHSPELVAIGKELNSIFQAFFNTIDDATRPATGEKVLLFPGQTRQGQLFADVLDGKPNFYPKPKLHQWRTGGKS